MLTTIGVIVCVVCGLLAVPWGSVAKLLPSKGKSVGPAPDAILDSDQKPPEIVGHWLAVYADIHDDDKFVRACATGGMSRAEAQAKRIAELESKSK